MKKYIVDGVEVLLKSDIEFTRCVRVVELELSKELFEDKARLRILRENNQTEITLK